MLYFRMIIRETQIFRSRVLGTLAFIPVIRTIFLTYKPRIEAAGS